jgi:hypothetical protein
VQLTLIELEATDMVARESCRKYLPEPSSAIIKAFSQYLDNVLKRCQTTADQRFKTFQDLRKFLSKHPTIVVRTAGALRTSLDLLEVFPLIDQPKGPLREFAVADTTDRPSFICEGEHRLSRDEVQGLWRVVRILHAIVVGKDHNNGTLETGAGLLRKLFDTALNRPPNRTYPELKKLHSPDSKYGVKIDCDKIVTELADLWTVGGNDATPAGVRSWINAFYPVACSFQRRERMRNVFERARTVVADRANGPVTAV